MNRKEHGVSNWNHLNSLQTFFYDIDFNCFTQGSTYSTFYFVAEMVSNLLFPSFSFLFFLRLFDFLCV